MSHFVVKKNKYLTTFTFTFSNPREIEYVYESSTKMGKDTRLNHVCTEPEINDALIRKMKLHGLNVLGKFSNSNLHQLQLTVPTLSLPKYCIDQNYSVKYLPRGNKLFILFDKKDQQYNNNLIDLQLHLKMSSFNDFEQLPIDLTFEKISDSVNKNHFYRLIMITIYCAQDMNIN